MCTCLSRFPVPPDWFQPFIEKYVEWGNMDGCKWTGHKKDFRLWTTRMEEKIEEEMTCWSTDKDAAYELLWSLEDLFFNTSFPSSERLLKCRQLIKEIGRFLSNTKIEDRYRLAEDIALTREQIKDNV